VKRGPYRKLLELLTERDSLREQNKRLVEALEPFAEYIIARHEIFGTESRASWPEMYIAGKRDIVRADWERVIAAWAEKEQQ
jgi:hypothetical protein